MIIYYILANLLRFGITFEMQLFQFISVPSLKARPVLVIFTIFRMVF